MKAMSRSNRGRAAAAPESSRVGPTSGVQSSSRRSPPKTESRESKRGTAFLEQDSALDWDGTDSLASEYIASATGCEAVAESSRDEFVLEEIGGPFVDLPAEEEAEAMRSARWLGDD